MSTFSVPPVAPAFAAVDDLAEAPPANSARTASAAVSAASQSFLCKRSAPFDLLVCRAAKGSWAAACMKWDGPIRYGFGPGRIVLRLTYGPQQKQLESSRETL